MDNKILLQAPQSMPYELGNALYMELFKLFCTLFFELLSALILFIFLCYKILYRRGDGYNLHKVSLCWDIILDEMR